MNRVQVIAVICSITFLIQIGRLIAKGKLREEYAFIWIVCTLTLVVFSFWKNGLDMISSLFGIYAPPNMVFTGSIFAILIYLLHLSLVVSKLQKENKTLAQEIALIKEKLTKK